MDIRKERYNGPIIGNKFSRSTLQVCHLVQVCNSFIIHDNLTRELEYILPAVKQYEISGSRKMIENKKN